MGLGVAGRRSEGGSERRNVSASDRSQRNEREYHRQNLVHGIVPSAKMTVGGEDAYEAAFFPEDERETYRFRMRIAALAARNDHFRPNSFSMSP